MTEEGGTKLKSRTNGETKCGPFRPAVFRKKQEFASIKVNRIDKTEWSAQEWGKEPKFQTGASSHIRKVEGMKLIKRISII
jgi:hypothetical protein